MPEPRDLSNSEKTLTKVTVEFDKDMSPVLEETSVVEVTMVESLLTPGLQTSIKFQNFHQYPEIKLLEKFKGVACRVTVFREILRDVGLQDTLIVAQRVYRLDKRSLINFNNEQFTLHLCDDTLLNDARNLVSKSWVCTTPTQVVQYVLKNCVNAKFVNAESSSPARDYIAENIHPFQVVNQQADVALASGNDPSFVHFMTYEGFSGFDCRGTHHFRSLNKMAKQSPTLVLMDSEATTVGKYSAFAKTSVGGSEKLVIPMLTYSFPTDFDLLSDILNGVYGDGNSLIAYNPLTKMVSLFGNQSTRCGLGGLNAKEAWTNQGSPNLTGCPTNVEKYLHKRQARMDLLDENNVAFRTTIPWMPSLHVGQVIEVRLTNKNADGIQLNYGSGKYLISSMVHNVKNGGYSTTTLDCVASTVSGGEL